MSKDTRTSKSIKNAQVSVFYYFVQLILGFFARKIFFDYLGSEVLGLDTTAGNLIGMLGLAELGIGSTIGYFMYKPLFDGDTDRLNKIVALQGWLYRRVAAVIIGLSAILMLFFPWIFEKSDLPLWMPYATFIVMLIGALIGYFFNFRMLVLDADQKTYKVYRVTQGADILFKVTLLCLLPFVSNPFLFYLGFTLLSKIFGSVWLNYIIRQEYPWLSEKGIDPKAVLQEIPDIITKTKQVFVHRVSGVIFDQICPLLMYAFTSLTIIAYYGNYLMIAGKISSLIGTMFNSTGAAIGNLIASGDKPQIHKVFWELIDSRLCITWTCLFSIYFLVQSFIIVWLGEEYLLSGRLVALLVIQQAITMNRTTVDSFLYGHGLFRDIWAPAVEGVAMLVFSYVLGSFLGIEGVLLGVIISQTLIVGLWKPFFLFTQGFMDSAWDYFIPYAKRCLLLSASAVGYYYFFKLYDYGTIDTYLAWGVMAVVVTLIIASTQFCVFYIYSDGMKSFVRRMSGVMKHKWHRNS